MRGIAPRVRGEWVGQSQTPPAQLFYKDRSRSHSQPLPLLAEAVALKETIKAAISINLNLKTDVPKNILKSGYEPTMRSPIERVLKRLADTNTGDDTLSFASTVEAELVPSSQWNFVEDKD
ncbi:hypothetical protein F2Q69_00005159 [Brassica cretica]|uniref:Uncharacterized protein n=1 Tax=Brassica cretica TaxID=69181 RepID=A0A8S9P8E5_BRACR|nr:hypothetical protein F2Q69_00005159 [Brassica cretica]